jgi:transcriptional regulator with XRE-family HTH domain
MPDKKGPGRTSRRPVNYQLNEYIRSRRNELRLTQDDLVRAINEADNEFSFSYTTVSHWERRGNPVVPPIEKPRFVAAMARALNTTPYAIYQHAGWLEGMPSSDDRYNALIALMEQATPQQRELIRQLAETIIAGQHIQQIA